MPDTDTIAEVTLALELTKALKKAGLKDRHIKRILDDPDFASNVVKSIGFFSSLSWPSVELRHADVSLHDAALVDTGLHTRISNHLRREGMETLKHVALFSKREVSNIRTMGSKSMQALEALLDDHGLGFRPENVSFRARAKDLYGDAGLVPLSLSGWTGSYGVDDFDSRTAVKFIAEKTVVELRALVATQGSYFSQRDFDMVYSYVHRLGFNFADE